MNSLDRWGIQYQHIDDRLWIFQYQRYEHAVGGLDD